MYMYRLGVIIGNTFVILVYRYFTYKFFILIAITIFIMANIGTNIKLGALDILPSGTSMHQWS